MRRAYILAAVVPRQVSVTMGVGDTFTVDDIGIVRNESGTTICQVVPMSAPSEAEQAAAEAAGPEDGLGPHTAEDDAARREALALQRTRDHEDAQGEGEVNE